MAKKNHYYNDKPAVKFDQQFGTHLSQDYSFPGNRDADEIWDIIKDCISKKSWRTDGVSDCDTLKLVLDNLGKEHFPLNGIEGLDDNTKLDILMGMSSGFNIHDIYWFSIKRIMAFMNKDINDQCLKLFPYEVNRAIQWVISPPTFEKMKKELLGGDD